MGHTCKDSQLETLVLRDCSVEEFESSHRTIKFDRRIEINTEDQVGVASKHLDTLVGRSSSVPDTKRSRCSANRRTMLDRRYHSRDLLIDGSEPLPALTAPLPTPLPPLGIASYIRNGRTVNQLRMMQGRHKDVFPVIINIESIDNNLIMSSGIIDFDHSNFKLESSVAKNYLANNPFVWMYFRSISPLLLISSVFESKDLIPISYYDELPLHLPKTAIIQGTGGCVWKQEEEEVYFEQGWPKFVKDNALVDDSDDEEEDSVYSLSNGKDTDTGNSSGQYNLENKGKSKEEVIKEESDGKEDSDHSLNSEDKERDTGS
ncbi:hypothetical protein YC2023_052449 [Brassica napus]